MKNIAFLLVFLLLSGFANAENNKIQVKSLGENSVSFIINSDVSRTLLVIYPTTEMLPDFDAAGKFEVKTESINLLNLKPIKNNAYVVFDGVQSLIPITIKGLNHNSGYFITMLKPDNKNFKKINFEFATLASEPTKQAGNIAFRQPTENAIELIWTNGNGEGRIVVVSEGKNKPELPKDGTPYVANAKFGDPKSKIGKHTFVVFSGKKNDMKVDGLKPATNYIFQVFEFNGENKSVNYLTDLTTGNPRNKMTIIPPPKVLPVADVHEIGFTARWEGIEGVEKYVIDIAYDEQFTKFADTYEGADVGDITEIEVIDLDTKSNWFFRVRAFGEGTVSHYSETLKVK